MNLHFETRGDPQKPALVLLHGWGLHSGVWAAWLPLLVSRFQVLMVDLPGFGKSSPTLENDDFYAAVLAEIAQRNTGHVIWLGWSLGGLHAIELARRYPDATRALCLMAATPCFLRRPDWLPAMPPEVFADFSDALRESPQITLEGFLSLQCKGSARMRADIRYLHDVLAARPLPPLPVLQAGLQQLARSDVRQVLRTLATPVLALLGEKDVLVPAALATRLPDYCPQAKVVTLAGAAHALFVSHPSASADVLWQFSQQVGAAG